jgi:hypothetical protein
MQTFSRLGSYFYWVARTMLSGGAVMGEVRENSRPDFKAVLFLLITLGLAALEVWGLVRLI